MPKAIPCIRCGRGLENVTELEGGNNQPHDGLEFSSRGHYGSTVFDPVASVQHLHISVCDPCIVEAAAEGRVYVKYTPLEGEKFAPSFKKWGPDED